MVNKIWERRRYVILINRESGKAVIVDTYRSRLSKMRFRIYEWAEAMAILKKEVPTRMVMIMLTYKKVGDYKPGHINDYMKKIKQSVGKNIYGFAWVAELQDRGAVHYHLVMVVKKRSRIPMPDKSGMWKHGWSGIRTAKTPFYLLKYTGKEYQKDLQAYPKSCRLYAVSYRLPEGVTKAFLDTKKELEKMLQKPVEELMEDKNKKWEYLGACVTKGYAEKVLVPSGYDIKN